MSASTHAFERQRLVSFQLTQQQTEQLAPIVLDAASKHKNVLFISVVVPFWSSVFGTTVWDLQVIVVPARIGHKILKLIGPREGAVDK
jgi:hypothetical protein